MHKQLTVDNSLQENLSAIKWAGLTEGEVADALNIKAPQWSKIRSRIAHFPTDKYHEFNRIVGNKIITVYDALMEGCILTPIRSALEQENLNLHNENKKLHHEMEVIKKFIKETSS